MARGRDSPGFLLGAHVSVAGGVQHAPARGAELGAEVIQIFTKPANRWAEPAVAPEAIEAFREGLSRSRIRVACSHDSYLINLASPNPALYDRSYAAFCRELERCHILAMDIVVTHPGNATDGDRRAGLRRNALAIRRALAETRSGASVLLEGTAGQGTALGSSFEELAELIDRVGVEFEDRMGVCIDTAHLYAAGYDLVDAYDRVIDDLDRIVGLDRLRLWHLNDSKAPLGSRVDRHEHIGLGALGPEPFRRIMQDPRFSTVPKVIETPKGDDDQILADRRNLNLLRRFSRVEGKAEARRGRAQRSGPRPRVRRGK